MKTKVAINGFGRIGRAAFKIMLEKESCEVVGINDLTDAKTLAHLLKYDSIFRRYKRDVSAEDGAIIVDGTRYPLTAEPNPSALPWKELEVDVVLECTGHFVKDGAAYAHIDAGAKRVVLSAPAKGDGDVETRVIGVSEVDAGSTHVTSSASCTTNCISPVARVIVDTFGVEKAMMTTIHSYTSTQNLQDGPHKDPRRGRAAAQNMIPTSTGAALATIKVIPELVDKFDGFAVRVPTINVSLTDMTFLLKQKATPQEINDALIKASSGEMSGVLGVTDEPLVSSDFIGDPRSSIVDLSLTKVVDGDLAKIVSWYDNEWGYSNRLVESAEKVGSFL